MCIRDRLYAPDVYMDKIACGPGYPAGILDIDASAADNVKKLAKAKGVTPSQITVCVLDRARHGKIIDSLRNIDARVSLITDGDVQGVIATTDPDTQIDMYVGSGGAPEGVLAAAALRCIGGQMLGRLTFRNDDEIGRARRVGIDNLDTIYDLEGLASGPTIFSATGVTQGTLLDGVKFVGKTVHSHTLVMNSIDGSVQKLRSVRPIN